MNHLDLFLLFIIVAIPVYSTFRGGINEFFGLVLLTTALISGYNILKVTWNPLLIISMYVLLFLLFFIIKKLTSNYIEKNYALSKKWIYISGMIIGLLKVFLIMIFVTTLVSFMSYMNEQYKENFESTMTISLFKKITPFINYEKTAVNLVADFLSSKPVNSTNNKAVSNSKSTTPEPKEIKINNIPEMEKITSELLENPVLKELLEDEEFINKISSIDFNNVLSNPSEIITLLKDPQLKKALSDPEIRKILQSSDIKKLLEELKTQK